MSTTLNEPTAVYLLDGYSRSNTMDGWYRDLTVSEAKDLSGYETLCSVDRHGKVRQVKLNGKPKTWKSLPGCELSLKYGLYEYFRVGDKLLEPNEPISQSHQPRIVVPVQQKFEADTPPQIVTDWVREKRG